MSILPNGSSLSRSSSSKGVEVAIDEVIGVVEVQVVKVVVGEVVEVVSVSVKVNDAVVIIEVVDVIIVV